MDSTPANSSGAKGPGAPFAARDFIRAIVAEDLAAGRDGGRVVTRFPPEPNGYAHIGHAKSICLNFGIAEEVPGARCNLRFDDTNPETEDEQYVEAFKRDVAWLGFEWGEHLYFASDYFERMYEAAVHLIREGRAYVDSQTEEQIRETRGTVTEPGRPGPYRDRGVEENLDLFRRMREGEFPDGAHVLRAKIDLASPNMLMRDPVLYRIRHASHYRTGDAWCIYPLYDFAHPLEDAFECVTHSLCTLEFEINRALYDWVVENTPQQCRPRQYEFARLNLDYTVMSKRKLLTLVREGHVSGWDDPRMPTIAGLRRRGVTPEAVRAFCDMIGVAKTDSRVDIGKLEFAIRDDLNDRAPRVLGVLRPLRVVLNADADADAGEAAGDVAWIDAPLWPRDVGREGSRRVPLSAALLIERDDFAEDPPADWRRLAPGRAVRLRHGPVIRCDDVVRNDAGEVVELRCTAARGDVPADWDVGGAIHWVSEAHAVRCEVRLYDRLFRVPDPDATAAETGQDVTALISPESLVVVADARLEPAVPALARAAAETGDVARFQLERLGYFAVDQDSTADRLVLNRTVGLRDTWARRAQGEAAGDEGRSKRAAPVDDLSAEEHQRLRRAAAPERSAALEARRRSFEAELGLGEEDAELLTREEATAAFFEAAVEGALRAPEAEAGAGAGGVREAAPGAAAGPALVRRVANWVINELPREIGDRTLENLSFGGADFGALVGLLEDGTLSSSAAREVLAEMVASGGRPADIVERRGLRQISDEAELAAVVDRVVAANAGKADAYRGGKTGLLGFFMGQVMRETGGKAKPEVAKQLLEERLGRS